MSIILIISSLFILSLQSFFPTTLACSDCAPSACGNIHNISYPFRLKDDPPNCGDSRTELACENNVTSIYLNSHKFYVKDINYHNETIRLVDASINNDDTCSFPNSSTYAYNFSYYYPQGYPFDTRNYSSIRYVDVAWPINFMSCPYQLNKSSLFTDISHDCSFINSSHPRFTYIKLGHMNISDLPETCRLEMIVMTSWEFKDWNNVSLSKIHHSLLYGFQLIFQSECFVDYTTTLDRFINFLEARLLSPMIMILLVITVLSGLYSVMAIIGATVVLGLLLAIVIHYVRQEFSGSRQLYPYSVLSISGFIPTIMIICVPRFIICPFVVWLLIYKFRRRHLSIFDSIESFLQGDNKLTPIRYSYSQIKKITRGFQDKLGEGGYGSVYKGKLRSGHDVAVKLLGKSRANGQDFINEIATIGRIHHVNVVKLVGYCAEGSKRALVLDFMPHGSLEKYLFSREKMNYLDWDTKFEISVGVARGIEYLHRGCDVQILHFDIKPHNILLDDNFIPKISDFGLAKFCSTDKNTMTMTTARGTIGYVAPELISRSIGVVSYKADVYSFGMLLVEMVGLKKDLVGNNDDSSQYFPNWIYDCFNKGKEIEIEKANENDNKDESDSTRKLIRKMTIVALWCIQMSPDDRPSMNKVLKMLEGDVECLQIPDYHSQSSIHIEVNVDQTENTCSTGSLPLLNHDDLSSCVEITVEE